MRGSASRLLRRNDDGRCTGRISGPVGQHSGPAAQAFGAIASFQSLPVPNDAPYLKFITGRTCLFPNPYSRQEVFYPRSEIAVR